MIRAPLHPDESARLAALHECKLLDTPAEVDFDDITRLAASICRVPIAVVSLVDAQRQWFKSCVGMSIAGTGRDVAFCAHAILGDGPLVVSDARLDERFADNPLVTDNPQLRFYAGIPLRTSDGLPVGTLCIGDRVPRHLTDSQLEALTALARQAAAQINLRRAVGVLRSVNENLAAARLDAERASAAKTAFLASVGHDVRTPLTAILGYAEVLADDSAPREEREEGVRIITRNARSLLGLMTDLLDLARVEAGSLSICSAETDPAAVAAELVEMFQRQAVAKGLSLAADAAGPLPERVLTDPTRLRQILANLLAETIARSGSGRIRVAVSADEAVTEPADGAARDPAVVLRFEVTNTPGPRRKHAGVNDPAPAEVDSDQALGLSIARQFAQRLGGDLTAHTNPSGERRFVLTLRADLPTSCVLPARRSSASAERAGADRCESARVQGRILLVQDSPDAPHIIAHHLRCAGASVELTGNEEDALAAVLRADACGAPFDLVLVDVQARGLQGLAWAKTLRESGCVAPMVALVPASAQRDVNDCNNSGCDAVLSKPIDRDALLNACAGLLRPPRAAAA